MGVNVLSTLALWWALLRLPIDGGASLLLAAGLAPPIAGVFVSWAWRPRRTRWALASLIGLLGVLAVVSSGRQAVREWRALASLPAAPKRARNVLMIVWDTVRVSNISSYGYARETTPNLTRWARKGVLFRSAVAPAPWTLPSHGCFFNGQWPHQSNTLGKSVLDTPQPTLAEYLASRGYQTVGFSANTSLCNYETGLDRGFARFEDYPLTPWTFLGRVVPGRWLLEKVVCHDDYHARKWVRTQSRDARQNTDAFLDWLGHRQPDRPFFAFLNYYDAHAPYIPPADYEGRFGLRLQTKADYEGVMDYYWSDKEFMNQTALMMVHDNYDDCIAYLDAQLGRLMDTLQDQGLLDETLIIITSDHGEGFGLHRIFGHASSLYLDQTAVPLVILAPGSPQGRIVADPVSLRDLPATVVDQLGVPTGSPFPGRSLAVAWKGTTEDANRETSLALSTYSNATAFEPQSPTTLSRRGFQMSLVALGRHYVRDSSGAEQLYDLQTDSAEQVNLMDSARGEREVGAFRRMLLELLTENPGSVEVERAILKPYRQWLEALVPRKPVQPRQVAGTPVTTPEPAS